MRRRSKADGCDWCGKPRGNQPTVPVMGGWRHVACCEAHTQWLEEYTQRAIDEGRYRPEPTPTAARELGIGTYGGGQ